MSEQTYEPAPITQLTRGDLETIWRAAKRLDREAESWREGWCIRKDGEWVFPDPPQDEIQPDIEVRVMGIENSSRMLKAIANKLCRKGDIPFDTEAEDPKIEEYIGGGDPS